MLKEPLVYFLLAGAALFFVAGRFDSSDDQRIVVTDAERARLADQWQAQMGRPPTQTELAALTEQWIREEIYYREALLMGLDDNDVIIRRRLAQKLTFLTEDVAIGQAPSTDALRDYYATHARRYTQPERLTFAHRYFSSERREHAEADARAELASDPSEGGIDDDPFMLQKRFVARSQREIGELFGGEFAAALANLPTGSWQGPIRSAYGWHLVRIEERIPSRQLSFEEAEQRLAADFRQQQRQEANEAFYESLRSRYEIEHL